ncbi:Zinc transporter 5 [Malassezia restricta CBS 7877]|jgi:cation diffusion facilitator family transporter|uniref:Zinc transporter 5 n=1 Tax=Malassezia restricta (strain ATCC 96810 / NBRC 103918 / CBS 7877) TaxID=425264 RepID=A0A3G2S208_MALR7|nr:Zinc transporter 5 [Malassezia restricta CBS 7877]
MADARAVPTQPDPRKRGHVKVDTLQGSSFFHASHRIRIHHLLALLVTKTLVASAAWLTRQWLLVPQMDVTLFHERYAESNDTEMSLEKVRDIIHEPASVWAVAVMTTAVAAIFMLLALRVWRWDVVWSNHVVRHLLVLGSVTFLQLFTWLTALKFLGATNTLLYTQFCEVWMRDIQVRHRWTTSGGFFVLLSMAFAFVIAALTHSIVSLRQPYADMLESVTFQTLSLTTKLQDHISLWDTFKGFLALIIYAILSVETGYLMSNTAKEVGGRRRAMVLAISLAATILLPISMLGAILGVKMLPAPFVPGRSPTQQDALEINHLAAYLVLALGFLVFDVLVTLTLESYVTLMVHIAHAWPMVVCAAMAIGFAVFNVNVSLVQVMSVISVGFALRAILRRSPLYMTSWYRKATVEEQRVAMAGVESDTTLLTDFVIMTYRLVVQIRRMINVILSNNESRRIFLFLCLNLAFMFVQLVWGVWTNSLGLISDAIHMFFDCAAIFMGLMASVMASWKTNKDFPFGYKRVETLSGFANGVFLVLISVFILFEAVQRIIEPPVMNNMAQLLIVSTLGLLVNLFGMFAMGHHHHGHSHGCSHSHDHHHGHSHNMLGLYLHVMADTLGSVGVIISTILIHYFHWTGFDPIASLLIGIMILGSVVPLVIDSGRILCLELDNNDQEALQLALEKIAAHPIVSAYSSAHFWPLDGETIVGTIHIHYDTLLASDASSLVDPSTLTLEVKQILHSYLHSLEAVHVQLHPGGQKNF